MTRGRLYRLRKGELSSNGHRIYGCHYVKKSQDAPAGLLINEEQASIVRQIFEMFASGQYGLLARLAGHIKGLEGERRRIIASMLRNKCRERST